MSASCFDGEAARRWAPSGGAEEQVVGKTIDLGDLAAAKQRGGRGATGGQPAGRRRLAQRSISAATVLCIW